MALDQFEDLQVKIQRRSRPRALVRPAVRGQLVDLYVPLTAATTDATATLMATKATNAVPSADYILLEDTHAYGFRVEVVAVQYAGSAGTAGDLSRQVIEGTIRRGAGAATTALVDTPTVVATHSSAAAATWAFDVQADATNGGLAVEVTGQVNKSIRWDAKVSLHPVAYSA
jgi:hypothetical protein